MELQPAVAHAAPLTSMPDSENLVTEEVAELFRVPAETVRYWRHIGKGPRSFKVGRRVLYAREDVETFLASAKSAARDTDLAEANDEGGPTANRTAHHAADPTANAAIGNVAGDELRRRQAIREQADAARNASIRQRHQQVHRD